MSEPSWRLRVTAIEPETARVSARRHQFTVGQPIAFDAEYGRLTALEYTLGALGAELVTGLRVFAKRRRIELDQVEAVVDGELQNPLMYLEVVGETGHPALTRISIKVYVASPHDEETVRRLWADALQRLPLVRTFASNEAVQLNLELTVTV